MARLTPDWNNTSLPETQNPGYASTEMDVKYLASPLRDLATTDKRPMVVYFYGPGDLKDMARIEEAIFKVETVGASLRAFKLYKLDVSSIEREDLRKAYAKNTPKFYFMDPNGTLVTKLDQSITTPNFLAAVKKAFAATYQSSYDDYLKAHRGILDRVDANSKKKALIEGKREQLKSRPRNDKTVSLEKELVKDDSELKSQEAKATEDESKLFKSLKLRQALASKN